MVKLIAVAGIGSLALFASGCGKSDDETVSGIASVLNGFTDTTGPASVMLRSSHALTAPADGSWYLAPRKLTVTVVGIGFFTTRDPTSTQTPGTFTAGNCVATYDRGTGSLTKLNDCAFTVAAGTYVGVNIQYLSSYQVLINDDLNSIYTDPAKSFFVTTTKPMGGGQTVTWTDIHSSGGNTDSKTFFKDDLVISKGGAPKLNILVDPTHWFTTKISSGAITEPLGSDGDPPVIPSVTAVSNASYYTNVGTTGNFVGSGTTQYGLLVFYGDKATPTAALGRIGHICQNPGESVIEDGFNGNGTTFGNYGYLGLSGNTLAWALAAVNSNGPTISGYRAVVKMDEVTALGGTTTLSYKCTASPPLPTSGSTYSSGVPSFTPDGTRTLTLMGK